MRALAYAIVVTETDIDAQGSVLAAGALRLPLPWRAVEVDLNNARTSVCSSGLTGQL